MLHLTKEEVNKAFDKAIAVAEDIDKVLSGSELSDLANLLMAVGRVKNDAICEAISTALLSFIYELQTFNVAFSAVPSIQKDLKPKIKLSLKKVVKNLKTLKNELLKDSPDHKKILESVGYIFFEYHKLNMIRARYAPR